VKVKTESGYYRLKNIARIRCFVSNQDLEKLVHAFITFRVDYCNGVPKKTIKQLQLIQNRGPENMNIHCKKKYFQDLLSQHFFLLSNQLKSFI